MISTLADEVALLVGQAFRDGLAYGELTCVDRDAARVRREDDARERTEEVVRRAFDERFGEPLAALARYEALTAGS
jgi:hypothetical protein